MRSSVRGTALHSIIALALAGTGLCAAAPSSAQLAPDTPRLASPHGAGGIGIYWLRGETLPGDGDAVLMTFSPGSLPDGMRLRAGGGKGANGEVAGFGGVDMQTPLMRDLERLPVELDWYSGLGFAAGEYYLVTLPLGLSGGTSWSSGSVWVAPYVSAGLAADLRLGEAAPAREFEVHPAIDLGLDLALDASRWIVVRAAASLGDRQTLAAGVSVGGGARTRD
jgi:hypothetical protein